MTQSNTLFLVICSNTKRRGGESHYDAAAGVAASLAGNVAQDLFRVRRQVLGLIKQDSEKRDDVMLMDLPRNQTLVAGPDLGGTNPIAQYLPAVSRYWGSFYRAIGADAPQMLSLSRHHILILSGLYGLLRADEPIQDYSCHIDDHPEIRPAWTAERQLTDYLLAYLHAHGITRIFDFTALAGYRQLINWNTVKQRSFQVWHAFGRQTVGDGFLTPLGELFGQWLRAPDDSVLNHVAVGELSDISTDTEAIHFSNDDQPPPGFPREVTHHHQAAANKDEIVRLARCLKYLLADIRNDPNMEDLGIEALKKDGKVDPDTAHAMHQMIKRRNAVEHDARYSPSPSALVNHRENFRLIQDWATKNDLYEKFRPECREA